MNKIYLPSLKSIHLKHFSLYPNGLDFKYNFVNGVNLILGGNGIGKTTFINIIKYGIIGLYKKEIDVRTYKREKRENRTQYSMDYFRNRMDNSYENNTEAKVVIKFQINETIFRVTRSLYDIRLEDVVITENGVEKNINGKIINQAKYQRTEESEKTQYLQFKYEKLVTECSNVYSFDDVIFLLNNVLYFGETRETILWNSDIQEKLSSKYFNEPTLDHEYNENLRQAKYFNSLSRHNSEDIRALTTAIDEIKKKSKVGNQVSKLNELREIITKNTNKLNTLQNLRMEISDKIKVKLNDRVRINHDIDIIERKITEAEYILNEQLWGGMHPNYDLFFSHIEKNKNCPMCSQDFEEAVVKEYVTNIRNCFLCKRPIRKTSTKNVNIVSHRKEYDDMMKQRQNIEKDLVRMQKEIDDISAKYNEVAKNKLDLEIQFKNLEHSLHSQEKSDDTDTFKSLYLQIQKLENEKNENSNKSKKYSESSDEVLEKIDNYRINITRDLSKVFSTFAESFLKLNCFLTYDDFKDGNGKRYVPVINNIPRLEEEELSESQRFFVDQSFRMSILNYFYSKSSFFICETPDSSLDISYENNAAKIFLEYLKKPNCLIITSNFNNSQFLEYIVENAPKINFINLLKIGKPTAIQAQNASLLKLSKRIEEKINGR